MHRQKLAGAMTAGIGAALMVNALLGPLVFGVIRFHESASMETQLLGGEMTSLFLAGPIAMVAGVFWWRGSTRAAALALGPLGYALYTCVQLVLVPDYGRYAGNNERAFPLYLLVVTASWITGMTAWREVQARPAIPPQRTTATLLGGLLLGVNALFALAWWGSIASIYAAGPSTEYGEHPTAFWLVRLMDLAFVIPVGVVTGLGLLQRKAWAVRPAYAFTGIQALLACAVAGMALRMWLTGEQAANGAFAIGLAVVAAALCLLYCSLMTRAWRVDRRIALMARGIAGMIAARHSHATAH